jgi:hypothetical protein
MQIIKNIIALFRNWERQTDAEFSAMSEIERQAIADFISSSTY